MSVFAGQLYFMTIATNAALPAPTDTVDFFSVDDILTYVPFFADFGPLNLGQVCHSLLLGVLAAHITKALFAAIARFLAR